MSKLRKSDVTKWSRYFDARLNGMPVLAACRKSGIAESTAYRFERNDPSSLGLEAAAFLGITEIEGNPIAEPVSEEARKALNDFAYFRLRYFGRKSTPWQERAAYEILRLIEDDSADKHYVVMNEFPGSGKSTLFGCDIPTWLIARNRRIRIMIGSRTASQAAMYSRRIKRALERDAPLLATADDLMKGRAFDAQACLQDDFTAFRPPNRSEKWQDREFTCRQLDGVSLDDKEATVTAWGMDSGFLGGRYDFVIWDDLVDKSTYRTDDAREKIRDWWDTEAETRIEPGGVILLQGQRLSNMDLYRYCLDKRTDDEQPMYRHVVFKAHDETKCTGSHGENGEPVLAWPEGCLLDPSRLTWKEALRLQRNPRIWSTVYQQEDGAALKGLVHPNWITGGVDDDGYPAPGCRDDERNLGVVPEHLQNSGFSFITVDPSPSNYWGIIWWGYDADLENYYVLDLARRRMTPQDFLSMDLDTRKFSGLLKDWTERALAYDFSISHVTFEMNAAQKWAMNQPYMQRWMQTTGQRIVPHMTGRNKQNDDYGVESLGDLFRQGRMRLPWGNLAARGQMAMLVEELVNYPDFETTDLVMSTWFAKLTVEKHYTPRKERGYAQPRPTWMSGATRGLG